MRNSDPFSSVVSLERLRFGRIEHVYPLNTDLVVSNNVRLRIGCSV